MTCCRATSIVFRQVLRGSSLSCIMRW